MKEHECTWTSGSVIIVDNNPKIKANCDICDKEIIKDFSTDSSRFWQMNSEEHKEKMERFRAGLL